MECITILLIICLTIWGIVALLKILLDHTGQTEKDKYLESVDKDLKSKGL